MMSDYIPAVVHEFVTSAEIPLTLSDPGKPDNPLVLANVAFCTMSGYSLEEIIGENCRFLQGPETQLHIRRTIAGDLLADRETHVLIRNYRKSGEQFDNYLAIFTLKNAKGQPFLRVGSQFEVPQTNRSAMFKRHIQKLLRGIERMNALSDITRQQRVDLSGLNSLTPTSLLFARLEALKLV